MEFIIDTREKLPLTSYLRGLGHCSTSSLKTGDYSIKGFENSFAIERKTLQDFIGSITRGRGRFQRELERAQDLKFFAIVIECDYADIRNKNYRGEILPQSIFGTIFSWTVRYKIPIILIGTREGAALAIYKMAKEFLKNVNNA